jgi:hypothetical protein
MQKDLMKDLKKNSRPFVDYHAIQWLHSLKIDIPRDNRMEIDGIP